MQRWNEVEVAATVAQLHDYDVADAPERTVRWCSPLDTAIVLGRAQDESILDGVAISKRSIAVVRRRSGGGVVLVEPSSQKWFDVVVPKGDELWTDDVNASFHWLGDAIVRALGITNAVAHKGAMVRGAFANEVCFLGIGPGETLIDQKKVVGISQRRRRSGAVFQCSVLTSAGAQDVSTLVHVDDRDALALNLDERVGFVDSFEPAEFESGLMAELSLL